MSLGFPEFCFTYVSSGIFLIIATFISYWYVYIKPWKHLNTIPGALPLFGHLLSIPSRLNLCQEKSKWYKEYGNTILLWIFHHPYLLTCDPKLVEEVLRSPNFISKGNSYWVLQDWVSDGILISDGEKWRNIRKELTYSFHFDVLKDFADVMQKHSLNLVEAFRKFSNEGHSFDVLKVAKRFSLGVVCETSMGIDLNDDMSATSYMEGVEEIINMIVERDKYPWYWYNVSFKLFPSGSTYFRNISDSNSFVRKVIEKRLSERGNEGAVSTRKKLIFIESLLNLYKDGKLDLDGIIAEVNTFLFAGFETVSTALSWCLYMLGRYPECQQQAFEECLKISKLHLSHEDQMKNMEYLECVIKESLRMHPPAPKISRLIRKTTVINGMKIPKGTDIAIDFLELHRNESYWENPLQFDPERFSKERNGSNLFLYLPFSAGPRNCIGQRFALMELKLALYNVLLTYEVTSLQDETELIETAEVIHRPENGLVLNLKERK